MHSRAGELVEKLELEPHPEGGFYRRVFCSSSIVTPGDARGPRPALTAILYLLTDTTFSRWHRVKSNEAWHLCEGGPLEVVEIDLESRSLRQHRLVSVDARSARPMCVIPSGNWQAARCGGDYALMGCTVSPGFDFSDFKLLADDAPAVELVRTEWPEYVSLI